MHHSSIDCNLVREKNSEIELLALTKKVTVSTTKLALTVVISKVRDGI